MKPKRQVSLLNRMRLRQIKHILKKINALKETYEVMPDDALPQQTELFKERLANGETLDDLLPEAFALVREAAKRVLGMFPYDVQVIGGIVLHQGRIAEMKTGEGKTLTATMPLYLNALSGKGAFLVTTNDYLARRDQEEMGKLYRFLGLTVAAGVFDEDEDVTVTEKQQVYNSDIVYTTSSALGFDYLTENLSGSKNDKFLRPFNYVIVDEADSVLLDLAQTPLIISGSPRVQSNLYAICDEFVNTLSEGEEYKFKEDDKIVYLTEAGVRYAQEFFDVPNLYDLTYRELNRHINLALRAKHLYIKNRDYVVADDEVKLLDNSSGRIMEGTRLQAGIHQAIETKEGVKQTQETRAMASVTYQSFFNMFPKLAGMTGTGKIAEDELIETYKLEVVVVPTHRPVQRIDYPDQIYTTLPEKLYATLEELKRLHAKGQPILLVSGTVEVAEIYSNMLLQEGISHSLLTANNLVKEAQIIKEAGRKGAVTVATSLAGRGTDIKLGEGVAELGGLAVLGTERMDNSRTDWQLRGRSGRQGDPGMSKFFVSLEDDLFMANGAEWVKKYFDKNNHNQRQNYGQPLTRRKFKRALEQVQQINEDKAVSARQSTVQFDEALRVQRNLVYRLRDELIDNSAQMGEKVAQIMEDEILRFIHAHPDLDKATLRRYILENFSYKFTQFPPAFDCQDEEQVLNMLMGLYEKEMVLKRERLKTSAGESEFYRLAVLKAIDNCWVEEVDNLQQLKMVVASRSLAQRDPMYEYYSEAKSSYERMSEAVKDQIVRNIMLSTIELSPDGNYSIYFV